MQRQAVRVLPQARVRFLDSAHTCSVYLNALRKQSAYLARGWKRLACEVQIVSTHQLRILRRPQISGDLLYRSEVSGSGLRVLTLSRCCRGRDLSVTWCSWNILFRGFGWWWFSGFFFSFGLCVLLRQEPVGCQGLVQPVESIINALDGGLVLFHGREDVAGSATRL